MFHTQPIQQPPYEPTLTGQTSYIARIVPDTVLSDRCEKFSRQSGSVASTVRPPRRAVTAIVLPVNGVSAESLGHISGVLEETNDDQKTTTTPIITAAAELADDVVGQSRKLQEYTDGVHTELPGLGSRVRTISNAAFGVDDVATSDSGVK
ncbi:hypothetical protein Tco_1514381 [Tanacetum coccineum]